MTSISDGAFDGCDSLTILCCKNSYAEQYAGNNGIPYTIIPAPDPAPEPLQYKDGIYGDVDGDGYVTVADALHILMASAGIETAASLYNAYAGDVDGDGALTSIDAVLTLRYSIGLEAGTREPLNKSRSAN